MPLQRLIPAGVGMCTPRPTMGKKKTKAVEYGTNRNSKKNITKKQKLEDEEMSKDKTVIDLTTQRNNLIAVLAQTAKKKNKLVEQEFAYKLFERFPHTAEADAFFAEMRRRYVEKYTCVAAAGAVVGEAEVVPGGDSTTSEDSPTTDDSPPASNDVHDNGSYFDARGLYVPGGFARDDALDNLMEGFAPQNNFSQEDEPLPPTQCLILALQRVENVQDVTTSKIIDDVVVDSQLTTLD